MNHRRPATWRTAALCAAAIWLAQPAFAIVLQWPSSPGWTAGAPAPGQTVSQSFTASLPNDVTVSINNNGSNSTGATWNAGYPAFSGSPVNGGLAGTNGLQLYVTSQSSTSSYVQVTVSFAYAVSDLAFQIWDVDTGGSFIDRLWNIQATTPGGGLVGATSITSAVSGYNTITGSGLDAVITGTAPANNTTNQGTVNISFAGPVTSFSFRWSNSSSSLGGQGVALGPLTFTPIPESKDVWPLAIVLLAGLMLARRARSRRRFSSL